MEFIGGHCGLCLLPFTIIRQTGGGRVARSRNVVRVDTASWRDVCRRRGGCAEPTTCPELRAAVTASKKPVVEVTWHQPRRR